MRLNERWDEAPSTVAPAASLSVWNPFRSMYCAPTRLIAGAAPATMNACPVAPAALLVKVIGAAAVPDEVIVTGP